MGGGEIGVWEEFKRRAVPYQDSRLGIIKPRMAWIWAGPCLTTPEIHLMAMGTILLSLSNGVMWGFTLNNLVPITILNPRTTYKPNGCLLQNLPLTSPLPSEIPTKAPFPGIASSTAGQRPPEQRLFASWDIGNRQQEGRGHFSTPSSSVFPKLGIWDWQILATRILAIIKLGNINITFPYHSC